MNYQHAEDSKYENSSEKFKNTDFVKKLGTQFAVR
jgi:hypothetical protein